MNVIDFHFVGPPCGQHGPYTFYKAFAYKKSGKYKIVSLGDFFCVKISAQGELCVAELQLLWEDKNNRLSLASSRLYFPSPDTIDDPPHIERGEDEVMAMSEKAVLRLEELVAWITPPVPSKVLPPADHAHHHPPPTRDKPANVLNDNNGHVNSTPASFCSSNNGYGCKASGDKENHRDDVHRHDTVDFKDFEDCSGDRIQIRTNGTSTSDSVSLAAAPITVLSYPRYCRYRAVLKRLENVVSDQWLKSSVVEALGGTAKPSEDHRILFCRETVERPDLEQHPSFCNHLAPNLKGRPRKKFSKCSRGHSPSSESNASDEAKDTKEALRKKLSKIKIQNFKHGTKPKTPKEIQEEEEFLRKLFQFMRDRNTPIERVPHLGFKQINLHLFYSYAQNLGGYDKVTGKKLWKKIYDVLGGSPGSTSAATCTRRHYERLLLPFERYEKGEEDKPLPPPVKHRKTSSCISSKDLDGADVLTQLQQSCPLHIKDTLCASHHLNSKTDSNDIACSGDANSPPENLDRVADGSPLHILDERSMNLGDESSTSPLSSLLHSVTPALSPSMDSKSNENATDLHSHLDVPFLKSVGWEIGEPNQTRKRNRDEDTAMDSKWEDVQRSSSQLNDTCAEDVAAQGPPSSSRMPRAPSSFTNLLNTKDMPNLSAHVFPVQETSNDAARHSFEAARTNSPPLLVSSVSPPPLMHIQTRQIASPAQTAGPCSPHLCPTASSSPSVDHLPSPPPLVDLSRVVNALPPVQEDLERISLNPAKPSHGDEIQDLSSPKRFRAEDLRSFRSNGHVPIHDFSQAYGFPPRIKEELETQLKNSVSMDDMHSYSLPFLHLAQYHDGSESSAAVGFKHVNGVMSVKDDSDSSSDCRGALHMPPLISRPSVIQHTQKSSSSYPMTRAENASPSSNFHPLLCNSMLGHRQSKSNTVAAHQQHSDRQRASNFVQGKVGSPNGSVQYFYRQYYPQSSVQVPVSSHPSSSSSSVIAQPDFLPNRSRNPIAPDPPRLSSSSPQYYSAPKMIVQPQSYHHSSPYINHYCIPYDNYDDVVLDLSVRKTKDEDGGRTSAAGAAVAKEPSPSPKDTYNFEYERITPPDKELDLSVKYEPTDAESSAAFSTMFRCTPSPGGQLFKANRECNGSQPPSPRTEAAAAESDGGRRTTSSQVSADERCKSAADSPIDVTSTDVKEEAELKPLSNCRHPMCTSGHCFPYMGKQVCYPPSPHLSPSYCSSSFYGYHPSFLLSSSRAYPPEHMQASLAAYKELFHPGLLAGHYPYSLTSQIYPHLYKEPQPYLYQPK